MGNDLNKLNMKRGSIIAKFAPEQESLINDIVDGIVDMANDAHRAGCSHNSGCTGTFQYVEEELRTAFLEIPSLIERERLAITAAIYYAAGVNAGHGMGLKGLTRKELREIQEQQIAVQELKDILDKKNNKS